MNFQSLAVREHNWIFAFILLLNEAVEINSNVYRMFFCAFRWDPKKRMTPDEACRHEWLQPSANSSYSQNKSLRSRQEMTENNVQVSPKSQKFSSNTTTTANTNGGTARQPHQTPNTSMVLPEVKTPSKYTNYKLYKDRTKGN